MSRPIWLDRINTAIRLLDRIDKSWDPCASEATKADGRRAMLVLGALTSDYELSDRAATCARVDAILRGETL